MKLISILFAFAAMAGCDFHGSVDPNIECTSSCEDDQTSCKDDCDQTCISDTDEKACVSDCDKECDTTYDDCTVSCDGSN